MVKFLVLCCCVDVYDDVVLLFVWCVDVVLFDCVVLFMGLFDESVK